MRTLKSLYFPGTSIYSPQQYPMFLLPLNIHILQPVEDMAIAKDATLADTFIKNGFCQGYTPKPLGEDRGKFIQLLNDIQQRKDDYAAQLSHLTIAAMSDRKERQLESRNDILSSLISGQEPRQKTEDNEKADLWKARLILKLAEILEKEEEDLSRNLTLLEDYETELIQELQGIQDEEEGNPFADLQQLKKNMISQRAGTSQNRLKAWQKLVKDSQEIKEIETFVTDSNDATELLLERFHEAEGKTPEVSFSLSLPAITSWNNDDSVEQIVNFRKDFENHEKLITMLKDGKADKELIAQWNTAIEKTFPENNFGKKQVRVYHFNKYGCFNLLESRQAEPTQTGIFITITANE